MKDYLLIFRVGLDSRTASPEQLQNAMMRWKAWLDKLAEGNRPDAGSRLSNTRATIEGKEKKVVDGPYIEGKEMVGGYMMIKAADLQEAIEVAKGCPIFDLGGSTEVIEAVAN